MARAELIRELHDSRLVAVLRSKTAEEAMLTAQVCRKRRSKVCRGHFECSGSFRSHRGRWLGESTCPRRRRNGAVEETS